MSKLEDLQKELQLEKQARLKAEDELRKTKKRLSESEKLTEKKLRSQKNKTDQQEERYKNIINLSSEAVWELDIKGKCIYSNAKLVELLGYTQEELKDRLFFDFLDREGQALALKNYMLIKEGLNKDLDFKLLDKYGNDVWVLASVKPKWEDNQLKSVIAILTDITFRKKAENEIKDLKDFYQGVLDSLPTDLAVLDVNQNYIYANPSFINDSGIRNWIIGKNDVDLVKVKGLNENLALKRAQFFKYVIKSRENIEWEEFTSVQGRDDSHRRRLSPVFNAEGDLKYVISFGVDVNERIAAEKKTNLLKELVNNSTEGLFIFDSKGTIKYANFVAESLIGISDLDNDETSLFSSEKPLFTKLKWKEILNDLQKNVEVIVEVDREIDGKKHIIELKLTYVITEDDVFIVVFSRDATERKQFEEELINAKNIAETASSAKAQFLSVMSHEIRTPMNAVIGLTHLLLQNKPREDQKENLHTLKFSAENLLALINDILDFSKIEAGKIDFESVDFLMKDIINGLYHSFHMKAEEKSIAMVFDIDEDLPEVLVGDPTRLIQIFNNLVSNAVKFTNQGKVVVKILSEKINDENLDLLVTISDSGIGIPPEKLDHVFESFTQASSSTTRKFGGTGLGLAITKKLIDLQDGEISVKSVMSKGTSFKFKIPLGYKKGEHEVQETGIFSSKIELFSSLKGYKILLVEDNIINVMVAKQFLEQWELYIVHAENGKQAIEALSKEDFDVILMDIQMPEMDGYTATTVIRKLPDEKKKNIPIVALTASAMTEVQERVFKVGMNDFITKPFNPNELYTKLSHQIKNGGNN